MVIAHFNTHLQECVWREYEINDMIEVCLTKH